MKINNLYNLYFSPTNRTKKVLHLLNQQLTDKIYDIDLTSYQNKNLTKVFSKEDVVFIGVPSYAGRVPKTFVERFLHNIKGNLALAVLVVTFGNRAYEDTLIELLDIAKNKGFRIIAGCAVVTQHSIIPEFGINRPDENDKIEYIDFVNKIKEKIINDNFLFNENLILGNRPYKNVTAVPIAPVFDKEKCIACSACKIACPTNAIKDDFNVENRKCISCLRCISVCPMNCRFVETEKLAKLKAHLKPLCSSRKNNEFFF